MDKYKGTLKIASTIETGEVEFYGIAVKKGNKEVLDLVSKGIEAVSKTPYVEELQQKWIGQ